jgi:hypothetical protein
VDYLVDAVATTPGPNRAARPERRGALVPGIIRVLAAFERLERAEQFGK